VDEGRGGDEVEGKQRWKSRRNLSRMGTGNLHDGGLMHDANLLGVVVKEVVVVVVVEKEVCCVAWRSWRTILGGN
jgi:hypothetical protein